MRAMFWLVWNVGGGNPVFQHPSETSARMEAERLARLHPGLEFVVMQSVGVCCKREVSWEETSDTIPF